MKTLTKMTLVAGLALSVTAPAAAQTRLGVGYADLEGAIAQSATYQTAMGTLKTAYATQVQQLEARTTAARAEIKPLEDAYRAAVASGNQASVQSAAQALQAKQQQLESQLAPLQQPIMLAQNYVRQQLGAKVGQAAQNVVKAKRVDLLVGPDAVIWAEPYVDLTKDIAAELSRLVPTVSVTPPAGAAAPAPASSAKPPRGR